MSTKLLSSSKPLGKPAYVGPCGRARHERHRPRVHLAVDRAPLDPLLRGARVREHTARPGRVPGHDDLAHVDAACQLGPVGRELAQAVDDERACSAGRTRIWAIQPAHLGSGMPFELTRPEMRLDVVGDDAGRVDDDVARTRERLAPFFAAVPADLGRVAAVVPDHDGPRIGRFHRIADEERDLVVVSILVDEDDPVDHAGRVPELGAVETCLRVGRVARGLELRVRRAGDGPHHADESEGDRDCNGSWAYEGHPSKLGRHTWAA